MIRIISTPVFAIHRKKSYTHIDTKPEDLLNKAKYEKERYIVCYIVSLPFSKFDSILACKYNFGKFLSKLIENVMKKY